MGLAGFPLPVKDGPDGPRFDGPLDFNVFGQVVEVLSMDRKFDRHFLDLKPCIWGGGGLTILIHRHASPGDPMLLSMSWCRITTTQNSVQVESMAS